MATIASVDIALSASNVRLRRDLDQAARRTRMFTRGAQGEYRRLNASIRNATRSFLAFSAALGVGQVLRTTDELLKLSQATSLTFEEFQRLQFALAQTGIQAPQLARGIARMSQSIDELTSGSGAAFDAFERLGVSLEDVTGRNTQEQFNIITDALRGVEDITTRTALAADLFGGRLATSLGPALTLTTEQLAELGDSINTIGLDDARTIEAFNDQIADLGRSVTRLLTTFSPFFSALGRFAEGLANIFDRVSGLSTIVGGVITAQLVGRFVPAVGVAARGLLGLANGSTIAAARASLLTVGYGAAAGGLSRFGATLAIVTGSTRVAAVAVTALRTGLALLGGPIGVVITGFTLLWQFFRDELVIVLRAAANAFISLYNQVIRLTNFLTRSNIAQVELYSLVLEDIGESAASASTEIDDFTSSIAAALAAANAGGDGSVIENIVGDVTTGGENLETVLDEAGEDITEFGRLSMRAFDGAADALTDFITTGMADFRGFVREIITGFVRIQARAALSSLFGGTALFGLGSRQFGGPVAAGQPYNVGESGPEVFVPQSAGNIVPNSALGGGNVTYNINAVDARSFQQLAAEDPSFIYGLSERGRRQTGL